ncbi:MAG: hypothetical protein P8Q54_09910 [Akkermansiaceae bacterium]|nr:hypothetical protein [Akkermansiaceae bacterium]MDG1363778.1 hypothetical protein [Akkermansiaceae bacterium]
MTLFPYSIRAASALSILFLTGSISGKEKQLEADTTKELQIRHSMLGFRDTLLFYTFPDQQAVLRLHISSKDKTFPVTGIVYLFPAKTSSEGIKKWINNQHSDGLFPDIPSPHLIHKLPKDICKAVATKIIGEKKNFPNNRIFTDQEVMIAIKAHELQGQFKLAPFKDQSGIFIPK